MRYKVTAKEYEKIERLVECALFVNNKSQANQYVQELHYVCSDLGGAAKNILNELISSTARASGRVRDKERLELYAKTDLYKLNDFVEENEPLD